MKHIQIAGKEHTYFIFPDLVNSLIDEEPLVGKTFYAFRYNDGKRFAVRHFKLKQHDSNILTIFLHQEGLLKNLGKFATSTVEIVQNNDHFFIVREAAEGVSLKFLLRNHAFMTKRKGMFMLYFFRSIMESLHSLETQQIVHSNLRPACLILHSRHSDFDNLLPECLVTDFSMSITPHFLPPDNTRIPHSFLYNAPEVILFRHSLISPSTDIYSAGIMLYEALKGHHPYRLKNPKMVGDMHLSTPISDFKNIHPAIQHIILKCTARSFFQKPLKTYSPIDINNILLEGIKTRYQSASEVISDIDNAISIIKNNLKFYSFPLFLKKYMLNSNPVVVYDNECILCTSSVQYLMKHDKQKIFRFTSISSNFVSSIKEKIPTEDISQTVVLIEGDKIYTKSDAFIKIMYLLGGWRKLFIAFRIIPKFIRNGIYNFIARNRYRWWGKANTCYVPPLYEKFRFLE